MSKLGLIGALGLSALTLAGGYFGGTSYSSRPSVVRNGAVYIENSKVNGGSTVRGICLGETRSATPSALERVIEKGAVSARDSHVSTDSTVEGVYANSGKEYSDAN